MKAIYCDKCKKLFPNDEIKVIKIEFMNYLSQPTEELEYCEKCHDKFEDFIYGK